MVVVALAPLCMPHHVCSTVHMAGGGGLGAVGLGAALPRHERPTGPVWEVLGLAIWHERRLVWTFGGVGNHFYYGVEGLQSTEIRTRNLTFACVLHQIALFRFWIDVCD